MSGVLLTTKFHIPPVRSGLVSRSRLLDRLNEGVKGKLTLVSAPAGFGKTTFLGEWISSLGKPVAWLSLEKEDNDPGRFWTYILAAIRTIQPDLKKNSFELQFTSSQSQIDAILTPFINAMAALPDPLLLILDDYHVIDSSPIQEGVIFLLDHMPAQLHLVVASRADPAWPLSRWRSRGQLMEIRAADLRFRPEEAADFLKRTMKLDLPAQDVTALEERTEGWIAGLQMAALSLQGRKDAPEFIRAFTGSNRYIFDYLIEEILSQQEKDVQEFLLKTSILERLSAPLCNAILGQTNSQLFLDRLEKSNLFLVPLDNERCWYRYHLLFADLLASSLKQSMTELVPELHRRASAWFEANGFLSDALTHALAAGDLDQLVKLVERYAFTIIEAQEASSLLSWLESLPDRLSKSYPWLSIAEAWLLAYLGRNDRIEQAIEKAEKSADPGDRRLMGYIAALRALSGEIGIRPMHNGMILARKALELLPQGEFRARAFVCYHVANILAWQGDIPTAQKFLEEAVTLSQHAGDLEMAMTAQFEIASILRHLGKLKESSHLFERTHQMADKLIPERKSLPVGFAYLQQAQIFLEWNELDKALLLAQEGIRLCKLWGYSDYLYNGWFYYSGILYETGDLDGALSAIREAKHIFSEDSPDNRVLALEAMINQARGDSISAVAWLSSCGMSPADTPDFENRIGYFHFAMVLEGQGRLDEAYRILESLRVVVEKAGTIYLLLKIVTQEAEIADKFGDKEKAFNLLQQALNLAEPEGFIRLFINKGKGMEQLLHRAVTAGIHPNFAMMLLEKFQETSMTESADKNHPVSKEVGKPVQMLVEPLSERELEVLRLLNTTLDSTEIAAELVISVSTVRTHIKNIYSKLNVNRRLQAMERAHALKLL